LGSQKSGGPLTGVSIAPSTLSGLVFSVNSIDFHTVNGMTGPSGVVFDSDVNGFDDAAPAKGGTDVSTLDMDNGYAHIYNVNLSLETFIWTYTNTRKGGVRNWGNVAAAFKAAH
jgi:hypothetical protein